MILTIKARYCDVCGNEILDKEIVINRVMGGMQYMSKAVNLTPINTKIYIKTDGDGDICLKCLGIDPDKPLRFLRQEEDFDRLKKHENV